MAKKKMATSTKVLIGVGVVVVLLILWFMGAYNGLITSQANVEEAWANVETQYQRRADLIPNLVEVVKESKEFQQETFTEVTALRSQWQNVAGTGNREQQFLIGETMGSALSRLLVTVERYPDLNLETFNNLQAQLEGTENRVAVSRQRYNAAVKVYNVKIRRIPTVFIANMFGFEKEVLFSAEAGAENAPKVDFG